MESEIEDMETPNSSISELTAVNEIEMDNEFAVESDMSEMSSQEFVPSNASSPLFFTPEEEKEEEQILQEELSELTAYSSLLEPSSSSLAFSLPEENNDYNLFQESSITPLSFNDNDEEVDQNFWLREPIYENSTVCKGDALYRILKLYVDNKLTKKALIDILETIDYLLPDDHNIPKTKYMLLKTLDKILPHSHDHIIIKHRICSKCCKYLGKWSEEPRALQCTRCESNDVNSFFLEYSMEALLKDAFEMRELHTLIDEYRLECEGRDPEKLYDLMSGSEYKRLKPIAIPGDYDLMMIWYTDGAQTAKSSSGSHLWPIFIQIVNVAPKHRRNFQFVCGLFYTNRVNLKPDMNSYLIPFTTALQNLHTNGVKWHHPTLDRTALSKVIAPLASLDAPARCAVQDIMQYNGESGCFGCEHPGETAAIGLGNNRVFPILEKTSPMRTDSRMKVQASIVNRCEDLEHFKGVKGESVVSRIPFFDRTKGFVPDYMHAILLGVLKMLLILWCLSKNHQEDFYLNPKTRAIIDKDLMDIAVPDNVTRTPGKLSELRDWKASQFRAFFFYGPIVLKGRLKSVYYEHFLLLTKAVYILSKDEISLEELDLAETLLYLFVLDIERLYGRNRCSYNVHQLTHMTHYVRMWGPLWVWSAFSSEDGNGELLRLAHGSNRIDVELGNTMKIINAYKVLKFLMNIERSNRQQQPELLKPTVRYTFTQDDINCLRKVTPLTDEQIKLISVYGRCKINNDIYTSDLYKRQKVRLNSCITWRNRTMFGVIKLFVKINGIVYCIVRQSIESHDSSLKIVHKEAELDFSSMIKPVRETYCFYAIPAETIEAKVIRVKSYICYLPNDVERK